MSGVRLTFVGMMLGFGAAIGAVLGGLLSIVDNGRFEPQQILAYAVVFALVGAAFGLFGRPSAP